MEWLRVQERLKEIIKVDVMSNEEWDFMATHMPFNHLTVQYSGRSAANSVEMSEEEAYKKLIYNPNDEHRMIIVRGRNGAGKSHLIRWFRSRLKSNRNDETIRGEKVIFVRRIDNSIRGAMRQFLDQDIVKDPAQKKRMQDFVLNCEVQSEGELKSTIYYNFIIKIDNEEEETSYKTAERKRLATFLRDDTIMNFLMREEGPITRFYELIARPRGQIQGNEATFKAEDFMTMRSAMKEVQRDGNPNTKRMFAEIIEEYGAEKLATYLNRFSSAVIQTCANISQGDINEMIRQLRLDLKKEGKALTVLIEDMTTFTGIDSELIKILSVQHGGEYDDLCRVTSIIGITDEYYNAHFRDNFKDRVTHQVSIDSSSLADEESLSQMAARYINAAYLTQQEVSEWFHQGAEVSQLPYRTWHPNFEWEVVEHNDISFSIFPFTKKSLLSLYKRLPDQTPRFFIQDVLGTQMRAWVGFRIGEDTFPNVTTSALGERPVQFLEMQHAARFEALDFSNEARVRLRALLCLWGDASLHESDSSGNRKIGGLPIDYLQLLGFEQLSGITSSSNPQTEPKVQKQKPEAPQVSAESEKRKKQYQDELNDIEDWYEKEKILFNSEDARRRINDFLVDAINWQMEGVPAYLVNKRLNTASILIEGQRQHEDREQAMVVIERNVAGYWLLLALTHWGHNERTWDFKDAVFMQLKLIAWLETHKAKIISRIIGEPETTPSLILQSCMALEFLRLGMTGGLSFAENEQTLMKKLFIHTDVTNATRMETEDSWGRVLKNMRGSSRSNALKSNKDMLIALPNTHMGSVGRQGEIRKHLYHRDIIDDAFEILKNLDWDASSLISKVTIEKDELHTSAIKQLQTLLPGVKKALIDEKQKATKLVKNLKIELGENLDSDTWISAYRDMADFLNSFSTLYGGHYPGYLRGKAEEIENEANLLARVSKRAEEIIRNDKFSQEMIFFSSNPCQTLSKALDTIKEVEKVANDAAAKAENELNAIQKEATDNTILEALKDGLTQLIGQMRKFGDDKNA